MNAIWISACLSGIVGTLWGEHQQRPWWGRGFKMLASGSFLGFAQSHHHVMDGLAISILAALCLCLVGDLLLTFKKGFLPGLIAFLLGHLAYVAAFLHWLPLSWHWPWFALAVVAFAAGTARWLWPHLGSMRIPVMGYLAVICMMLWLALSVGLAKAPWPVAPGAAMFAVSDLTVARHRFISPGIINRAVGLPLYYTAQLLLASTLAFG